MKWNEHALEICQCFENGLQTAHYLGMFLMKFILTEDETQHIQQKHWICFKMPLLCILYWITTLVICFSDDCFNTLALFTNVSRHKEFPVKVVSRKKIIINQQYPILTANVIFIVQFQNSMIINSFNIRGHVALTLHNYFSIFFVLCLWKSIIHNYLSLFSNGNQCFPAKYELNFYAQTESYIKWKWKTHCSHCWNKEGDSFM